MNNYMKMAVALVALLAITGCRCDNGHGYTGQGSQKTGPQKVEAQNFLMDSTQFDLGAVISKLKQGDIQNAEELTKWINMTPGINNVDIDKDGKVDEIHVTEEQNGSGKYVLPVHANPLTADPTVISEISFTQNTQTGQMEVAGAYPQYVRGYHSHYYHHTLTGSHIGDMMFYSWLLSPRPMYVGAYHPGMYYGGAPRSTMSQQQLSSTRTTSYQKHNVSPTKKQERPSSYKPQSNATKKSSASMQKKGYGDSKLSSRKGSSTGYKDRGTGSKSKASGWGSSKSGSKSSWGSGRSGGSRSGGFRSGGGSRKSNAIYKHDIEYLTPSERANMAQELYSLPIAEWSYNDADMNDDRRHVGIITQDVGPGPMVTSDMDEVDLYGYTSMAVIAIQELKAEIEVLKHHDSCSMTCQ